MRGTYWSGTAGTARPTKTRMEYEQNVTVRPYGRDERIGWDTHLICIDGKAALFSDGWLTS